MQKSLPYQINTCMKMKNIARLSQKNKKTYMKPIEDYLLAKHCSVK